MSIEKLPFNVTLLDSDRSALGAVLPVQTQSIYTTGGEFHPQGLYSIEIFGPIGSTDRQQRFSFIDMRATVMHPKVFMELTKLKAIYKGLMSGSTYAIWDEKVKDFIKSDIIDGQTGYSFFMTYFHDIIHAENDSPIRDLRIKFLDKIHDKCMYRYLVVIPAGLRDIETNDEGRVVEDDINGLYRKIFRASNTISVYSGDQNNPLLDTVRWSLQSAFNEIYQYIESILSGKHGFFLSKWAARNIHGGTRNVITALDAAPRKMGAPDEITVNDTTCGLFQYLKGTTDVSIFDIKNGPMTNVIASLPNEIEAVDSKTLKSKMVEPSTFIRDNWGSEHGIEKLINGFSKDTARHKPVMIDGNYAALIYRDDKYFKVFYDIAELPKEKSKDNVKPMTWVEMFYLSVYKRNKQFIGYITRYPITSTESIYPSFVFIKTTVKSSVLRELDNNWNPIEQNGLAVSYPNLGEPFLDSLGIHSSKLEGLTADYDGDFGLY